MFSLEKYILNANFFRVMLMSLLWFIHLTKIEEQETANSAGVMIISGAMVLIG